MDLHPDLQRWRLAQQVLSAEEVADRVGRWNSKPSSRVHGLVEQSNAVQRGRVPNVEVMPTFYIGEKRVLVQTSEPVEKPFVDLMSGGNGILDMYKWNEGSGNVDFDQKIAIDSGLASKYRQQLMHAPPVQPYLGELIEPPDEMDKLYQVAPQPAGTIVGNMHVWRPGYNLRGELPQQFVGGPPPAFGGDVQGMNALARAGQIGAAAQAQAPMAPIAVAMPQEAAQAGQDLAAAQGEAEAEAVAAEAEAAEVPGGGGAGGDGGGMQEGQDQPPGGPHLDPAGALDERHAIVQQRESILSTVGRTLGRAAENVGGLARAAGSMALETGRAVVESITSAGSDAARAYTAKKIEIKERNTTQYANRIRDRWEQALKDEEDLEDKEPIEVSGSNAAAAPASASASASAGASTSRIRASLEAELGKRADRTVAQRPPASAGFPVEPEHIRRQRLIYEATEKARAEAAAARFPEAAADVGEEDEDEEDAGPHPIPAPLTAPIGRPEGIRNRRPSAAAATGSEAPRPPADGRPVRNRPTSVAALKQRFNDMEEIKHPEVAAYMVYQFALSEGFQPDAGDDANYFAKYFNRNGTLKASRLEKFINNGRVGNAGHQFVERYINFLEHHNQGRPPRFAAMRGIGKRGLSASSEGDSEGGSSEKEGMSGSGVPASGVPAWRVKGSEAARKHMAELRAKRKKASASASATK